MDSKIRNISWFGTHSFPVVTSGGLGARPTHRASFIDPVFIICTDAAFPAECNMKKDTGYIALIRSVKQKVWLTPADKNSSLSFISLVMALDIKKTHKGRFHQKFWGYPPETQPSH